MKTFANGMEVLAPRTVNVNNMEASLNVSVHLDTSQISGMNAKVRFIREGEREWLESDERVIPITHLNL